MTHQCRFYPNEYPSINDVVFAKVCAKKDEIGYNVNLVEYNQMDGFLPITEVYSGRVKKKCSIKEGDIIPLTVLSVNKENNTVDLSKRKLILSEVPTFKSKYNAMQRMNRLGIEIYKLYQKFNESIISEVIPLERVMEETIWHEYDEEQNFEETFHKKIQNPETLIKSDIFNEDFKKFLISDMTSRLKISNMIMETEFLLLTISKQGVNALKQVLDFKIDNLKENYKLKILMSSPPHYTIILEGDSIDECNRILNHIIAHIESVSKENKVKFLVTKVPCITKTLEIDFKFYSNQHELIN